tara:strand:- start:7053 stop:7817 length:765 start_codon:yes stop_codon:yes gene_type:complete
MFNKTINGKVETLYHTIEEWKDVYDVDRLVTDWREGKEGDWVVTDDNQVCRVLKRGNMKTTSRKQTKPYIRTMLGTYIVNSSCNMEGLPPSNIYSFARSNHYQQRIKKDKKPTDREFLFAKYVANGLSPTDAYLRIYPTNNRKYADHTSKALMKTKRVSTLISQEMKANLEKVDINEEYLLRETKKIVEKEDSRDGDKLRAIETLMKIAGMFPDSTKTESLTVFQGFTQKELSALDNTETKTLAYVEKEIEDGE